MKKLSFLELEKEMNVLSKEEASRTKGGTNPGDRDCAFQSLYYIMSSLYGLSNLTEQGMEDNYNDHKNNNDDTPNLYTNYADVTGLQDINESDKGLGWINTYLANNCTIDTTSSTATYSASYENGDSILPNTTSTASNDQYIVVVGDQTDSHAVTFLREGKTGKHQGEYLCMDSQRGGQPYWYSPDAVLGVVDIHKTVTTHPSTTSPTTTFPTTTLPTTTFPTTTVF